MHIRNPRLLCIATTAIMLLYSCIAPVPSSSNGEAEASPTPTPGICEVVFHLSNEKALSADTTLTVEILDEETGIALNPIRLPLTPAGTGEYEKAQSFRCGSVIKYRYIQQSPTQSVEFTAEGNPVRYRAYFVRSSGTINDTVVAWEDAPYVERFGRIEGQITDETTGSPLANMLISIQGRQLITSSDGRFRLDNLAPGQYNLLIFHIDEEYEPFQQDVVIAPNSMTPVTVALKAREHIDVTFIVHVPENTPENAPIRMVGSTYLLGNTFSNLDGGFSILPNRAPVLKKLDNGFMGLTLNLPVGAYIRYKYTLGDGFWNAEHQDAGRFFTRELIVTAGENKIEDTVNAWQMGELSSVTIRLKAGDLPFENETPSLQLNPYGWTVPLPMWPERNGEWSYTLFSPLEILGEVKYRFCRLDTCGQSVGWKDDKPFEGSFSIKTKNETEIEVQLDGWLNPSLPGKPYEIEVEEIAPRENFIGGVEITPSYNPNWLPYFDQTVDDIRDLGANWIILSPTWTAASTNPPVFMQTPGQDALSIDIERLSKSIVQKDIQLALFPQLTFEDEDNWWATSNLDSPWWETWFDNYRTVLLNNARLANQVHANALILGGSGISPSLLPPMTAEEGGGIDYNPLPDTEARWMDIIREIKEIYSGPLIWATAYPRDIQKIPAFVQELDFIYILWSAPDIEGNPQVDQEIVPLYDTFGKPLIIGVSQPAEPGFQGCNTSNGYCPTPANGESVDFTYQADFYNRMLSDVNKREMIAGFVSRGFDPAPPVVDKSASINRKPAADVLKSWFTQILIP